MVDPSPGPDGGSLTVSGACATTVRHGSEPAHQVVINPDWTVTVPHDLEFERIAAALGFSPSCVPFVDGAVPAYRHFMEFASGTAPLPMGAGEDWIASEASGCWGPHRFSDTRELLRHEISARHLAARFDAPEAMVASLLDLARRAWLGAPEAALVVEGDEGVTRLWEAGIHPHALPTLAAAAPTSARPLSVAFYFARAFAMDDNSHLEAAVWGFDEPGDESESHGTFAGWAADATGMSPEDAQALQWFAHRGVSDDVAAMVLSREIDAGRVSYIAYTCGVSKDEAVRLVGAWDGIDCALHANHYSLLSDHGAIGHLPPGREVDQLVTDLAMVGRPTRRTEAAVALAVVRSRYRVVRGALKVRLRGKTLTAPTPIKFATTPFKGTR